MKRRILVPVISLFFISCNSINKKDENNNRTNKVDSIQEKENNFKAMLIMFKKDYPDGKNKIMDSTKKVFERKIKELDSIKNIQ